MLITAAFSIFLVIDSRISYFFLLLLSLLQNMSSLVERLRVRSDRRPIYNLDESDDDADLVHGKSGMSQEKFEKIVRSDAVCFLFVYF